MPERYGDFGPTLAAEHLPEDDGLHLGTEKRRGAGLGGDDLGGGIERYAVPRALYTEWKDVYVERSAWARGSQDAVRTDVQETRHPHHRCQLTARLRGRGERGHGTHQYRLVNGQDKFCGLTAGTRRRIMGLELGLS